MPDDVLVRELSREAVMLNLNNATYYGLNESGLRMWTVLTTADSIAAAYEKLLSEYHVEPDRLRHDLEELIDQCMEQGLLEFAATKASVHD
jgi:hypothetical protein